MLVVGHPGVAYEQGERHQEELDGRSDQARPFPLHAGVDVELHTERRGGGGWVGGVVVGGWVGWRANGFSKVVLDLSQSRQEGKANAIANSLLSTLV